MGVKIRKKKLNSGKESLYLDINHNGEREYEFLGLHLTGDRKTDKEKMQKAEIIKAKYLEKIVNNTYGLEPEENKQASFYKFFGKIVDENIEKGVRNHEAILIHIKKYHGSDKLLFKDITTKWVWGFRDYLIDTCNKQNTAHNYYTIFKAALNKAVKRQIIKESPAKAVDNIGRESTVRDFLTAEELGVLAKTECDNSRVKEAFFFGCQTGLRLSDIKRIQWKEVNGERIAFSQKKTTKVNYVPLNQTAKKLMGEAGKPGDTVFDIPGQSVIWKIVDQWGKDAKLDKHLHFHMSRHTFATQLLIYGSDIYTVAELLGVDLKTAEVYAKIINRMKDDAVNRLPEIEF